MLKHNIEHVTEKYQITNQMGHRQLDPVFLFRSYRGSENFVSFDIGN